MSNVDTLRKGALDAFFQNLVDAFCSYGNEVKILKVNDFFGWPNEKYINQDFLVKEVQKFNPDFIFSPNHDIPLCVLKNTNCKIVVYTADSPDYFHAKDYLAGNSERYIFVHGGWENTFPDFLNKKYGIKEEQNFYIGHMTNVHAYETDVKRNIGFIGFVGWANIAIAKILKAKKQKSFEEIIREIESSEKERITYNQVLTSNIRIKTLDAICDLGLEIYGIPANIIPVGGYSWELMKCFNFKTVVSTQDTEEILNSSLISPNLYNYQAPKGLSWRIADVMASNAVLISPPKPDLKRMSPYIDIPTFETPAECRELCQKLLKDEIWRKEIVAGSQKAIDDFFRPRHTLDLLSKILNLNLVDEKKETLPATYLNTQNLSAILMGTKGKFSLKNKIRYKVWKHLDKKLRGKGIIQ